MPRHFEPRRAKIATAKRKTVGAPKTVLKLVEKSLDDDKAADPVVIELAGRTAIADYMVVASGTSARHIQAMAEHLVEKLESKGLKGIRIEGADQGDWVLIDGGDIIVHLFRPEARIHYGLEKMWGADWSAPEAARA
ncbi:MAG: ribosome silencing factor [Tagaea sp.]|nr:ribosome silencing factor [Azospirillum sp.]MCA3267731.1 ribosome silencing factor [Azospirillum sp.]MCZ8123586.1 ribosome silencing factor [Magnetospirillum sp.]